jgi:hypothetical protein
LRTSPTPTSAITNAIGFSTALVMINEAQAGAPNKEMDNKFAMQDKDTSAATIICQGEINDLNVAPISNPASHCNPITEFHRVHKVNNESKRIAVAIIPRRPGRPG